MRLLLVEDHEPLGAATHAVLLRSGYAIDWVRSGNDVLASLASNEYDCVLLDLGLPGMSGEKLLASIRERSLPVAVIVLTALGGGHDRVRVLDLGADDYMVKPVDLDELSARLRAVLRRVQAKVLGSGEPEHGPLKLYLMNRTASWHGHLVPLTNKEFWLLEALVRRKNEILSRARLQEAMYGWGEEVDSNAIEVFVHSLRRKLSPKLILTVRGIGYQLGPEHPDD